MQGVQSEQKPPRPGGFYHWLTRKPSTRKVSNQEVLKLIREIYKRSKGRYGSPKITVELQKRGIQISRPRVARIMKAHGIKSVIHKRFRVQTTDSNHNYAIAKNLLDRNFTPTRINKAWVSDITYIKTLEGWMYLTTIVDLGDRKVIGLGGLLASRKGASGDRRSGRPLLKEAGLQRLAVRTRY